MSEPDIYTIKLTGCPVDHYVLWRDYEKLKAEIDKYGKVVATAHADLFAENARLKAEVDALKLGSLLTAVDVLQFIKLKEENERLTEIIRREVDGGVDLREEAQRTVEENHKLRAEVERLTAELSNISGWGRGLESDLSHARVEISFLKAEVERLSAADSYLQSANEYSFEQRCDELEAEVERLRKAGDAMDYAISEIDPQRAERHRFMKLTDAEYIAVTKWRTAKDPNYNRA